jgi:hypothetical protein
MQQLATKYPQTCVDRQTAARQGKPCGPEAPTLAHLQLPSMATATAVSRLAVLAPGTSPLASGRRRPAVPFPTASRPRVLSAASRGRVLCLAASAPASSTDAGQDRLQKVPSASLAQCNKTLSIMFIRSSDSVTCLGFARPEI